MVVDFKLAIVYKDAKPIKSVACLPKIPHSINSTKLSTHPRKNEKNSQFVMWDIAWNFGAPYAEEVNITQQLEGMVAILIVFGFQYFV